MTIKYQTVFSEIISIVTILSVGGNEMIGQDLVSEKYDNPKFEAETTYENVQKKSDLEKGMNPQFIDNFSSPEIIIFINFIGLSCTNDHESSDFLK